jgi:hypothetical protein
MSADAISGKRNLLDRILPAPHSGATQVMRAVVKGVEGLASGIGKTASKFAGVDAQYSPLLEKQLEVQVQMQLVSLYSNIEKSRHETEMAAIRNTRVG